MTVTECIFVLPALVKISCSMFCLNPTEGVVADTRSQMDRHGCYIGCWFLYFVKNALYVRSDHIGISPSVARDFPAQWNQGSYTHLLQTM